MKCILCIYPILSEHTPGAVGSHATAPGEQLEVWCLAQGHLSHGIEGGESAGYSLPPPTIPAGPEIQTHNLPLTSPTRYPLGHNCPKYNLIKAETIISGYASIIYLAPDIV